MGAPFLKGFGLGMGLIVAIGAQNAFVLRQGLCNQYLFITALICSVSDAVLITFGVFGFGAIVTRYPALISLTTWGGAIFVFIYGLRSLRSSLSARALSSDLSGNGSSLRNTILTTLAFTWLNPHVYLDTVVLVGSVGTQFVSYDRVLYSAGAMLASIVWFYGLVYGAARLAPLFEKPVAWRVLDAMIGIIMLWIAYSLVTSAI
jgi:L-lysine exporter family protein LysE/ArgO